MIPGKSDIWIKIFQRNKTSCGNSSSCSLQRGTFVFLNYFKPSHNEIEEQLKQLMCHVNVELVLTICLETANKFELVIKHLNTKLL